MPLPLPLQISQNYLTPISHFFLGDISPSLTGTVSDQKKDARVIAKDSLLEDPAHP